MAASTRSPQYSIGFSALQRAEIAEMVGANLTFDVQFGFSALQRAEIAEILLLVRDVGMGRGFSALQRAEIAEIECDERRRG